jgi:hypothetical protein
VVLDHALDAAVGPELVLFFVVEIFDEREREDGGERE